MNDRDFDALLESSVDALPPDDIVRGVTPWRSAMDRILTGFALGAVTFHFLRLEILLPSVGVLLHLLGFRSLCRENRWFTACWALTFLRAALLFPLLLVNATIYQEAVSAALGARFSYFQLSVQLALVFCFWQGVKTASRGGTADAAKMLFLWYVVLTGLCRFQTGGTILALAMIAAFVLILRSLFSLAREMEESGYSIVPAPVRISDGALVRILAGLLCAGLLCGYGFFGRYPMGWEETGETVSAEAQTVKESLLALGYPADALNDLSEKDILACRGAIRLTAHESDEPMNEGRKTETVEGNTTYVTRVYDKREMHFTSVAVQVSEKPERWMVFHHFRWTDGAFCGTEAVQLWTTQYGDRGDWTAAAPTGRVLYDTAAGEICAAPFAELSKADDGAFYAAFSFPARVQNARGYMTYETECLEAGALSNSWMNYTHQKSLFQYPVQTAAGARRVSGWDEPYCFVTAQEALQFWALDGKIEKIGD